METTISHRLRRGEVRAALKLGNNEKIEENIRFAGGIEIAKSIMLLKDRRNHRDA